MYDTPTRVNIAIASIAEPGDAELGRTLNSYEATMPGRQRFLEWLVDGDLARLHKVDPSIVAGWQSRLPGAAELERIERRMEALGIWTISPADREWPWQFYDLGWDQPRVLFGRGDKADLGSRSVGIVGARAATGYGEHVTGELATGLVERGFAITSGGAYGIDGMAHRATVAAGGRTIVFLAGGVDRFYPQGHDSLFTRILESDGVILSEVTPGAAPTKWRFLQRNRLIAAFSYGLVVVEAGLRSGSLNAAGHATGLNRPVMAVPGPITSPASAGCHRLLREKRAVCVTSADDVVISLGTNPNHE